MPEMFEPQDSAPLSARQQAVQRQMATAVRAVEELARGFSEASLKWQAAAVEADKLRVAFEATSDSRARWKGRALKAAEAAAELGSPVYKGLGMSVSDFRCATHGRRGCGCSAVKTRDEATEEDYRQTPWTPTTMDGVRASLSEAVGQAVGTGSRCWKGSGATAVFDDRKAAWVVDGLMAWLSDWADGIRKEASGATGAKIKIESTRLLNYALNLRMYGERAPGGDETWAKFDREAESFLRSLGRREHTDPGPSV